MDKSLLSGTLEAVETGIERLRESRPIPNSLRSATTVAMVNNDMQVGGTPRVLLNVLAGMLKVGYKVQLVLLEGWGKYLQEVPEGVHLIKLDDPMWNTSSTRPRDFVWGYIKEAGFSTWRLHHLPNRKLMHRSLLFARYLEFNRPSFIMPHSPDTAAVTMLALRLTSLCSCPPVVPVVHMDLSKQGRRSRRKRVCRPLRYANALIAVSQGTAMSAANQVKISPSRIEVVYNGVPISEITEKSAEKPDHSWFQQSNLPIVLGVGRLLPMKDFPTLMKAFRLLRTRMDCRLMILGDGPKRQELLELASEFSFGRDFHLFGESLNPYAYMRRAAVFAFSSHAGEACPMVLLEALACGCPIVSTSCDHGPKEILEDGRYGALVPVGDHEAMADALEEAIRTPPSKDLLRRRAEEFSVERCVLGYERVLASVTKKAAAHVELHRADGVPGSQAAHRQDTGVSQRGVAAASGERHHGGNRRYMSFGNEGLHQDGGQP